MTDVSLRPLCVEDLDTYRAIYEESFPPSERKSLDFMMTPPMSTHYGLWTLSTPTCRVAGLVILASAYIRGHSYTLLDYLAIAPKCRGQGLGHKVLPMVRELCQKENSHLFLEIEVPLETSENAHQRARRKNFYLSAGLIECEIMAKMYGTEMELLCYPDDRTFLDFEIYHALTKTCFPIDMEAPIRIK